MIISKTPFRVSLFGGSTDYVSFYEKHESLLIGFAMNKYSYITIRNTPDIFEHRTRVSYSKIETVDDNKKIEHNGVRGVLSYFGLKDAIEIHNFADLPARTGIGSSSSFVVGMVNAITRLINHPDFRDNKKLLSETSIYIERELLKEAGGIQDQIFAAYGGLISIHIANDGSFEVKPLPVSSSFIDEFLERSVFVYTGSSRDSFEIAKSHNNSFEVKKEINSIANDAYQMFLNEDIDHVGELLNDSWNAKKRISSKVSNNGIDMMYNELMKLGMIGGKLLGAGGSGFIFGVCESSKIANKIKQSFKCIDIGISEKGSEIIHEGK